MSSQDNNGLPHSFGNVLLFPSEDDLPYSDQGESIFSSSRNGGTGHHASSTLPPPPPMTLPTLCFLQVERYATTQALLACGHQNGIMCVCMFWK